MSWPPSLINSALEEVRSPYLQVPSPSRGIGSSTLDLPTSGHVPAHSHTAPAVLMVPMARPFELDSDFSASEDLDGVQGPPLLYR